MRRGVLLFIFTLTNVHAAVDCPPDAIGLPEIFTKTKFELKNCNRRRIRSTEDICRCTSKNLSTFPSDSSSLKAPKKALIKALADKVKVGYLNLIEDISSIQRDNAKASKGNLINIKKDAKSCVLKDYLKENAPNPIYKCEGKTPLLSEDERRDFSSNLLKSFQAEIKQRRTPSSVFKNKSTSHKKALIDRTNGQNQNRCGNAISDDFVADMRDEAVRNASDIILVHPDGLRFQSGKSNGAQSKGIVVDLEDLVKTIGKETIKDISLSDLTQYTSNIDFEGLKKEEKSKKRILESAMLKSPILKDLLTNPAHLDELIKRKNAGMTNPVSDYLAALKDDQEHRKNLTKKLESQCQRLKESLKTVLCASNDDQLLDNSSENDQITKAKIKLGHAMDIYALENKAPEGSDDLNEAYYQYQIYGTSQLLHENYCTEKPDASKSIAQKLEEKLAPDMSEDLVGLDFIDQAAKDNYKEEYLAPANQLCALLPGNNSEEFKLQNMPPTDYKEIEAYIDKVCIKSDIACKFRIDHAAKTLYGLNSNGTKDPNSILALTEISLRKEALKEVPKDNKTPAEYEAAVEKKFQEKRAQIDSKKLMQMYANYKASSEPSNLLDEMLFEPKVKSNISSASTQNAARLTSSSSNTGKNNTNNNQTASQKSEFNSAALDRNAQRITQNLSRRAPTNYVKEIFDRALRKKNQSSSKPSSSLSTSEKNNILKDAIDSFGLSTPKRKPSSSVDPIDEEEFIQAATLRDTFPERFDSAPTTSSQSSSPVIARENESPQERADRLLNNALAETATNQKILNDLKEQKERGPGLVPPAAIKGAGAAGAASSSAGAAGADAPAGTFVSGDIDHHLAKLLAEGAKEFANGSSGINLSVIEKFIKDGKPIVVQSPKNPNHKVAIQPVFEGRKKTHYVYLKYPDFIESISSYSKDIMRHVLARGLSLSAETQTQGFPRFALKSKRIALKSPLKLKKDKKIPKIEKVIVKTYSEKINEADPEFIKFKRKIERSSFVKLNFKSFYYFLENTDIKKPKEVKVDIEKANYLNLMQLFKGPKA